MFVGMRGGGGLALKRRLRVFVAPGGVSRGFSSSSSFQEQLLMRSVNKALMDEFIDRPAADLPQPNFSDCERLKELSQVHRGIRPDLLEGIRGIDPFALVQDDISQLNTNVKELLGSDHPVLERVAQYFFNAEGGKKVRPTMILLFARAAKAHMEIESGEVASTEEARRLYAAQIRLGEITEMIHTASLLHDDVIDNADTRRGIKSTHQVFGNKLAILAGDFLLARASVCLARLRDVEVVEILSTVLEDLVKGEVLQMKPESDGRGGAFEHYIKKTYYKTSSLMANSILATCVLAQYPGSVRKIAFEFGESCGQAFQLVDDCLDYEGSVASMGKPSLTDLQSGLTTAPILFAQETYPELIPMIERKFSKADDIESAASYVRKSRALAQTRDLAAAYSEKAIESILQLHPSPERDALVRLAVKIVTRKN